jgi:hypothetical protein
MDSILASIIEGKRVVSMRSIVSKYRIPLVGGLLAGVALAVILVFSVSPAPSQTATKPRPGVDPYAGLDAPQIEGTQMARFQGFKERYAAWLAEFNASGRNARSLPEQRVEPKTFDEPEKTLAVAVANAQLVVSGAAVKVEFLPSGALTTFRIDSDGVLKGAATPGSEITVRIPGGPYPTDDFKPGVGSLRVVENRELLLAGDRALLFLSNEGAQAGEYYPLSYTGVYLESNGQIRANESNPFASEMTGLSAADARNRVLSAR